MKKLDQRRRGSTREVDEVGDEGPLIGAKPAHRCFGAGIPEAPKLVRQAPRLDPPKTIEEFDE